MIFKKLRIAVAIFISATMLASCGPTSITSSVTSSAPYVNYVNDGEEKLSLNYKDRDFYKDGVGEVTLKTCIDGDTAHFNPVVTTTSSDTIKARFFGIDTPESTGKVQEYGKAASNYTKEKLEKAAANGTIVVSSPSDVYGSPSPDSTGTRYVSLIWINLDTKNASYDNLFLLNLWIVQDGYSYVKNVIDMPEYSDDFYAAETQAKALKLNLFSGEPDPLFNYGDYQDISLLDIKIEVEKELADSTYKNIYDNVKVRVQGTVAGFANHIIYIENYFSVENGARKTGGEYAGINIFTGMSSIPSKYTKRNTYIQVSGLALDSDNFGFQITSANFPLLSSDAAGDSQVLIKAEDNTDEYSLHTFEYAPSELLNSDWSALNCFVKITGPITVSSVYVADPSEITLYLKDVSFDIYITFIYKGNPENENISWTTADYYLNKTFTVQGVYTYHKTASGKVTYQINPCSSTDLVCEVA